MNSPVKTFRITKEVRRKLTALRRVVKPTRPGARKASEGDVLRESVEQLYAQRVKDGGHANRAAPHGEGGENAQAA